MESFTESRILLRWLGIMRTDSSRSATLLMAISNCWFFTVFICHVSLTLSFFLFDAQIFREYVECFFHLAYAVLILSWYIIHFTNKQNYTNNFNELDAIIAKSKWFRRGNVHDNASFICIGLENPLSNPIYQENHRNVQRSTVKTQRILLYILGTFLIPGNLMAIYEYIASDYSTETFKLLLPQK